MGSDAIAHRGPDGEGLWWSEDGMVGLAHRRLAVVDLSENGHQPMSCRTTQCTIVFNGEIYNHHSLRDELVTLGYDFISQCDTEVILAAYDNWGIDCLQHFKGMFAFALFDPRRKHLFLARDRAGEKPLFYSHSDGTIKFGSELKALMADVSFERRLSPRAMDMYLGMGYITDADCILAGVHKLPPAHYAIFSLDLGTLDIYTYWDLPPQYSGSRKDVNDIDLVDKLEDLLEKSIRMQLIADVPVGILLSGGVDSSLITAIASRISTKVKTFTIGFSGHADYDESPHAQLIADHFKTEHIELNAGATGPELLLSLARQYDEPIVDSSMLPTYLVSSLVREHCTVALGGDGADELFGGYAHYSKILKTAKITSLLPKIAGSALASAATLCLPLGTRFRNGLRALSCDLNTGLPIVAPVFDSKYRKKLLLDSGLYMGDDFSEGVWRERVPLSDCLLDRTTRMDFKNYLPEDILVKIDRASMLNSLELRAPFLDSDIIEFAFSEVPSRLKADLHHRKIILKKMAAKLLPSKFDMQRKQGFAIPLNDWLKSGIWREFFSEILYDDNSIFDQKYVKQLFNGIDADRANGERLFSLVMFELWRKEYQIII
jgi:asparagine synthase (glutamine-hydrolysing)